MYCLKQSLAGGVVPYDDLQHAHVMQRGNARHSRVTHASSNGRIISRNDVTTRNTAHTRHLLAFGSKLAGRPAHLEHALVRRQRLARGDKAPRLTDSNGLHWHVVAAQENLKGREGCRGAKEGLDTWL